MTQGTRIYAHRGASSERLENTGAAFERALELGAEGIETDVQLTRDGVSVLWHDRTLERLGYPHFHVGDVESDWLLGLDLSLVVDSVGAGERLLRLHDFVDGYSGRCELLLEVKNRDLDRGTGRHRVNMQQCLEAVPVDSPGADAQILVSSFDLHSLLEAHDCNPRQALVLNLDPGFDPQRIDHCLQQHPFFHGFCLPISDIDALLVERLRARDRKIIVYTCNTSAEIGRALELGVDILISDYPHQALALRG